MDLWDVVISFFLDSITETSLPKSKVKIIAPSKFPITQIFFVVRLIFSLCSLCLTLFSNSVWPWLWALKINYPASNKMMVSWGGGAWLCFYGALMQNVRCMPQINIAEITGTFASLVKTCTSAYSHLLVIISGLS